MIQNKILYRLQKLDLDIDASARRVRDITAALERDSALRQAEAEVTSLQEALRPQEAHAADLNLELQTVVDQAAQLTTRLYSGQVINPKELEDIQHKVAERKRRHSSLENELLETMISIEELQASLAGASDHLREVQAASAAERQALTEELQRLKQGLKTLKPERQEMARQVNPETLKLYDTLRASKQGRAVAVLDDDSCSVCRVGQTTTIVQQVRQGQELILCSSCGRILVAL
jgi:predicted  nucleic acid-binding Zn-ribbon protein